MNSVDADDAYRQSRLFLEERKPHEAARALIIGAHRYLSEVSQFAQAKELLADGIALLDQVQSDQIGGGWVNLAHTTGNHLMATLNDKLLVEDFREFVLEKAVEFSEKYPDRLNHAGMLTELITKYWWNAEYFWLAGEVEMGSSRKKKALELITQLDPAEAERLKERLCLGYDSNSYSMPTTALDQLSRQYRSDISANVKDMNELRERMARERQEFENWANKSAQERRQLASMIDIELRNSWKQHSRTYGELGLGFTLSGDNTFKIDKLESKFLDKNPQVEEDLKRIVEDMLARLIDRVTVPVEGISCGILLAE